MHGSLARVTPKTYEPAHTRTRNVPRGGLASSTHLRTLAFLALVLALVAGSGCDFLPQNGTEWTVALVIAGVLVVGVAVMAWYTTRTPKK